MSKAKASLMKTQRDAVPRELEERSVSGSVWSGDGTSATESSDNESVRVADKPSHGKPSIFLIGDGNARGSHETGASDV